MKLKKHIGVILAIVLFLSGMDNIYIKNDRVGNAKEKVDEFIVMSVDSTELKPKVENLNVSQQFVNSENIAICEMTESEANELARKEDGIIVERDSQIVTSSTKVKKRKSSSEKIEWNMKTIHADNAVDNGIENAIRVSVIDSGVDDYNDIRLAGSVNLLEGEENVSPLYVDATGHGSSVAGIIAAEDNGEGITGIAPEVELFSVKVFDEENRSTVSRVIDAIYWSIDNKINIINMSFGMAKDSVALHQAIKDAMEHGILMIASAGNGEKIEYPAAYDEVMAVGSINAHGEISEASAKGKKLEIVAPGEQICSTGAFGGVVTAGGTSMSAPHITGVAAKLWGKDSSVSANFIRYLLDVTANKFTTSIDCGNGLVDYSYAEKMYDELKKTFKNNINVNNNKTNTKNNKKEVLSFDDVDYVEGRWSGSNHEVGIVNSGLSKSEINVIKKGTIYPDSYAATEKLGTHPYWHGGYKCSNYISSYIYATNMALELKKGKSISSAVKPNGLSDADKSDMAKAVTGIKWADRLSSVTKKNKALFVWGMAIHDAMDVYAHSAWGRINGVWQHLDHPHIDKPRNGLADRTDSNAFPERYDTAVKVAKKSLSTYVNGKAGSVHDFIPSNGYKNAGITWAINKLQKNANALSTIAANSLKTYSCLY